VGWVRLTQFDGKELARLRYEDLMCPGLPGVGLLDEIAGAFASLLQRPRRRPLHGPQPPT
jgi:hypothetical protein